MRYGLKHPQSVEKPFGVIAPPRDKKKKKHAINIYSKSSFMQPNKGWNKKHI